MHPQIALDHGREFHAHQRIQPQAEQRCRRIDCPRLALHHLSQALPQCLQQPRLALIPGHGPQPLLQDKACVGAGLRSHVLKQSRLTGGGLTGQPLPIGLQHSHHTGAPPIQQRSEGREGLLRRQHPQPNAVETLRQPGGHPGSSPGPPLNRQPQGTGAWGLPAGRFHRPIGSGVGDLPRGSQQSRHRREGNAELHRRLGRQHLVQQLPPSDFGSGHRLDVIAVELHQRPVTQHPRPMDHTAQRLSGRQRRKRLAQSICFPGAPGQITGQTLTTHTLALKLLNHRQRRIRRRIGTPAHQHQRTRPLRHKPLQQLQPHAAQGTGHQIGGRRHDPHRPGPGRLEDHQLAHMPALGHQPKGLVETLHREGLPRDRSERTLLKRRTDLQQLAPQRQWIGRRQLQQIKAVVMRIGAPLLGQLGAPHLQFAELDKATSLGQGRKAGINPFALQAVEHHIHAAAIGVAQHLLGKRGAA